MPFDTLNNGDSGLDARTKINAAIGGLNGLFASPVALTANGAASTPALTLNGSIFTGGTSISTKPLFLIEPAGTPSTVWPTSGTLLGVNAPPGFSGDAFRACLNGSAQFRIALDVSGAAFLGPPGGGCAWYGGSFYPESNDNLVLGRAGVSSWAGCCLTSAAQVTWDTDAGLARSSAAVLKVTNGSTGYGAMDAAGYNVMGTNGADGSFTTADAKTVTIQKGIITSIV
jgi:hypothetical protein